MGAGAGRLSIQPDLRSAMLEKLGIRSNGRLKLRANRVEGYFRMSLTVPDTQVDSAVERLAGLTWEHQV